MKRVFVGGSYRSTRQRRCTGAPYNGKSSATPGNDDVGCEQKPAGRLHALVIKVSLNDIKEFLAVVDAQFLMDMADVGQSRAF